MAETVAPDLTGTSEDGRGATASLRARREGDVDVWIVRLSDFAGRGPSHPSLVRDDVSGLRGDAPRIATRIALRTLLGSYCGVSPATLRFAYGPNGKPCLQDASLFFSVSRRDGTALICVTRTGQIGVDLERRQHLPELDSMIGMLCPAEKQALAQASEAQRAKEFYRIWTRKEAALKATGIGLSHRLDAFSVLPDQCDVGGMTLHLNDIRIGAAWSAALATDFSAARLQVSLWTAPIECSGLNVSA